MADQRQPGIRLWLDGVAVDRPDALLVDLEVEERADEASSLRLTLNMTPIEGDWDLLEHGSFAEEGGLPDLRLLKRLTVELSLQARDEDEPSAQAVVFDGYVTVVEPVFGPNRASDSHLALTALDTTALMHFDARLREWHGQTDAEIVQAIYQEYGLAADVEPTSPVRELDRATVVQRCTDAELVRMLARRNGYEAWVEHADTAVREGAHPGTSVVGHFHRPRLDQPPQPTLALFPIQAPSLLEFRARWESHLPTRVRAWHIDERTRRVERADVASPSLPAQAEWTRQRVLDERLSAVLPDRSDVQVLALPRCDTPHAGPETSTLAGAALREADWFVQGSGTVAGDRYEAILRPRRPVTLSGGGHLLDGTWYVQAVRHRWAKPPDGTEPAQETVPPRYEADVTMVRNALGGAG